MKYGIVCRLEAPAVSLSPGPATAVHRPGAGAGLPQLPKERGWPRGAGRLHGQLQIQQFWRLFFL